jgi:DeoR family transcriptional regulator, suf operon transcriptional repressor
LSIFRIFIKNIDRIGYSWYTLTEQEELEIMTDTREQVLQTILNNPRCTIIELAESVGINPISIRHHITHLEAEGLIGSVDERHGVGRPRRVYFLTEAGVEQFPTRYVKLTIRLLKQLKESMPGNMVKELFAQMAEDLAKEMAAGKKLDGLSTEERLEIVKQFLRSEGFYINWESHGDTYYIHEASCPYYHVGQDHPEVCSVDEMIISTFLSLPISKTKCILSGDMTCTFVVPKEYKSLGEKL